MRTDRNGIPILDPPHEANKLPRECDHFWVIVSREFSHTDWMQDVDYFVVESRCRYCGRKVRRLE